MAIKGLRTPIMGKYSCSAQGVISYTEGKIAGKAIEYSADFETSDDNPLYADNAIAEHDNGGITGGTLTLKTDCISENLAKWLFGLATNTVTVGEGASAQTVTENLYNDAAQAIQIGFGIIEYNQEADTDKYRTVIFPKCTPKFPAWAAVTMGESIEWQTPEIQFAIEKADDANHKIAITAYFTSYQSALDYLKQVLGVTTNG